MTHHTHAHVHLVTGPGGGVTEAHTHPHLHKTGYPYHSTVRVYAPIHSDHHHREGKDEPPQERAD